LLSIDLGIAANKKYALPKGLFEEYLLNLVDTDKNGLETHEDIQKNS